MSDAEVKFKLVTNYKELTAPPPMRTETVILKDWVDAEGYAFGFVVSELKASEYDRLIRSGWTLNPDGTRKHYNADDQDIRLVAATVQDPHGHRLWPTFEEARAQLHPLGRASLELLVLAANRVNSVKQEDAEGNSGETPKDSSPTT